MYEKFDPEEFDAIRAALVSKPELTKDLNVSLRNVLRLAEHLQNSGLRMERHGQWIVTEGFDDTYEMSVTRFTCSKCLEYTLSCVNLDRRTDFCPYCGAKMDGGNGT